MNNLGRGGYSLWSLENLGIKKNQTKWRKRVSHQMMFQTYAF